MLMLLKRHFLRHTEIQKADLPAYIKVVHLLSTSQTLRPIYDNSLRDRILGFFVDQSKDLGLKDFQIIACKACSTNHSLLSELDINKDLERH